MSEAHLTTSRVNRLLRPLRNKCNSLAALPKPATVSCVTYSKQSSTWDPESRAPLIVLGGPAGIKKLTFDRHSADEFELSKRIYAVCDAFKNVAYIAFSQPCDQHIPSLAAICALAIGENMPVTDSDMSSVEEPSNRGVQLDVDDIYEAVPSHYRRFLIVSHALSMILGICANHHTLVTLLLDHCLSFGLVHESTHLLDIILAQAFLPSNPLHPPPVTHPAHANYLLNLHAKWNAGNKLPGPSSSSLLFTTSAFCRVLLGILSQSPPCTAPSLWTSKVLSRFIQVVESCDLDSYIDIVHALSRSFWKISGSAQGATGNDAQRTILRDKLSELMSNLFDLLFIQSDPHCHPSKLSRIYAIIDILYECHTSQPYRLRMSTPGSLIDLSDIIMIFTTHILVTFRNLIDSLDRFLALLDDSNPIPSTFSKLMAYFSRLQDSQAFGDFAEAFIAQLKTYSFALRSEKLFKLDASLWACALQHFETSIANSQKGSSIVVTKHRQQLMEAVDAAERRCFGRDGGSSPVVPLSIRRPDRAKRRKRGRLSGHWEWEDMVGSWIRKTPVHKKRKIEDDRLHSPRGTMTLKVASRSISTFTPSSTGHRCLPTLSPTSSSSSDVFDHQDESDKENVPSSSPPVTKKSSLPIKRQGSNFLSLLADAQTNRIVLHPKSRPEPKPPSSIIPEKYVQLPLSSQESRRSPHKREQKTSCGKVATRKPSRNLLPSDDSLDLFAYATSSPAR